jgi:hypothetical protein
VSSELSPPGQPDPDRPELRASHEDRDRVVEALRVAAGDGRLTPEELDDRLERALTARTHRELVVLTTDLPDAGTAAGEGAKARPVPRETLRIAHLGGNARQVGRWVVPKRIEIRVTGGSVLLDFTEAVITGPVLPVDIDIKGGHLTIITRPGIEVDAGDLTTFGGTVQVPAGGGAASAILRVELSGSVFGGQVRAHGRRRSFWQRLLSWFRRAGGPPALRG